MVVNSESQQQMKIHWYLLISFITFAMANDCGLKCRIDALNTRIQNGPMQIPTHNKHASA